MEQNNNRFIEGLLSKDSICLLLLNLFVFLLALPVFYFGIPNGYDLPQHYQFAFTFLESIKSGDLFPAWAATPNHGFGDIGIRFYPPLAHYSLALTQLVLNDWMITSWFNIWFWMILGSIGAYFLAKEWLTPENSLWVGILYATAPYHLSQIYQYFLYSEYVAAAILPFCFLFLTKVICEGKLKNIFGLGFFSALLIISHIPTTIVAAFCLTIYAVLILDWKRVHSIIPQLLISGILAVASTAFYWSRLITEMSWVNHSSPKFSSGVYNYQIYLFPIFFNQSEIYYLKQLWYKDIVALTVIAFILPLILFVIWQHKKSAADFNKKKSYLALLLTSSFAFFMSSSMSSLIWANFGFLQKIQFPFRWLSIATLIGVVGFVIGLQNLTGSSNIWKNFKKYSILVFLVGIFLFDVSQIILPSEALNRAQFEKRIEELDKKESFECWWTIWAKGEAFSNKEKVYASAREVTIKSWDREERKFEVSDGNAGNARIATFYYPYWQAEINGNKIETQMAEDGTILIPLSSEKSTVRLYFQSPLYIQVASIISILSWLSLAGGLGLIWLKKKL